MYKFSASENVFYHPAITYTSLPSDVVEVTEDVFYEFALNDPPTGKVRGAWASGGPKWVDAPAPTVDEITANNESKKSRLISAAEKLISPLAYAVELGTATGDETSRLLLLKGYVVDVNRIDATDEDITWPTIP